MKDSTHQSELRSADPLSDSLPEASLRSLEQPLAPLAIPSRSATQITLAYRVHREILRSIAADDKQALCSTWERYRDIGIRGEEALSLSLELGRFELVQVLLDLGAQPHELRSSQLPGLLEAGRFDVLKQLVEAGAPVNNESGDSEALSRAVQNFVNYIDFKFEHPASSGQRMETETFFKGWVEASTTIDEDLTNTGTLSVQERFFRYFIDSPFSDEFIDHSKGFDFSQIAFLLEHGARMDKTGREIRRDSLSSDSRMLAVLGSDFSQAFALFEKHGIQLRTDNLNLYCSESSDEVEVVESAIRAGNVARATALLAENPSLLSLVKNPLSKAVRSASLEMVRHLIRIGCDVNEDGGKPLLYACLLYYWGEGFPYREPLTPKMVHLLLTNGADPNMRGGEAFIEACKTFDDSLLTTFFGCPSLRNIAEKNNAALRGLLINERLFTDADFVRFLGRDTPALKQLLMVKSLVDRGADPCAALLWGQNPAPITGHEHSALAFESATGHYTVWGAFLRERLSQRPPPDRDAIDECYRAAQKALSGNVYRMQVGNESRQSGPLPNPSHRYCHLMAQVLDPTSPCWINSLIPAKSKQIPESVISPSLLQHDPRYKVVSDVAAITTVLHRPFTLRQKFIELAKASFSENLKLRDSQQSTEKVFEWLPTTTRLLRHFADIVLLPALLARIQPSAIPFLPKGILGQIREDLEFVAAEALFAGRSLRELKDFSKRWHALSARHPVPISPQTCWESLLSGPIQLPNGFVVKDLNSLDSLRKVGTAMNNCLGDGIHATECFFGNARILAIFKDENPLVAMTLEKTEEGWHLTEYEGPDYTRPDEGPTAPFTLFKTMIASNAIQFEAVDPEEVFPPNSYDDDNPWPAYRKYLDVNRIDLDWALHDHGINAEAFYRRWLRVAAKPGGKTEPLLTHGAIAKCVGHLDEMVGALSLYLQYSERLYNSYPN